MYEWVAPSGVVVTSDVPPLARSAYGRRSLPACLIYYGKKVYKYL